MGSLTRVMKKLVVLLLVSAVAFAALRDNLRAGAGGSGVVTLAGLAVIAYIAWTLYSWLRRLRPRERRRPPRPPELPSRASWLRPGQTRDSRHD